MSDDEHEHEHEAEPERVTSPMQAFGSSEVGVGLVVLVVGLLVTFALPLVLA